MKSFLIVILGLLTIGGCASVKQPPPPTDFVNPRIVYRDLTVPVVAPMPEASLDPIQPEPTLASHTPAGTGPCHFIEFGNDSSKNFDEDGLQAFMQTTPANATILVLGHSHGQSAVGTRALATRRAETIVRHLTDRGYANVHAMAAWGGRTVTFSPNRGVQLYVLDAGSDQVSIAFSKEIEKEPYHVSPERNDVLADHRTAQGGLDNV